MGISTRPPLGRSRRLLRPASLGRQILGPVGATMGDAPWLIKGLLELASDAHLAAKAA